MQMEYTTLEQILILVKKNEAPQHRIKVNILSNMETAEKKWQVFVSLLTKITNIIGQFTLINQGDSILVMSAYVFC